MPNRILKESICASEDLAKLSQGAEILFYRLIVKVDDFGAFYANPMLVKNACFPLKPDKELKDSQVEKWLFELSAVGLIILYTAADSRNYLQLTGWMRHQQCRAKNSKFPLFDDTCKQLIANDSNCKQMIADDSRCLQMSSITRTETESKTKTRTRSVTMQPPTLEDVESYVNERNSSVDPKRFYDFYSESDWVDTKGKPVRNWKQKLISWERSDSDGGKRNNASTQNSTAAGAEKWGNLYSN